MAFLYDILLQEFGKRAIFCQRTDKRADNKK